MTTPAPPLVERLNCTACGGDGYVWQDGELSAHRCENCDGNGATEELEEATQLTRDMNLDELAMAFVRLRRAERETFQKYVDANEALIEAERSSSPLPSHTKATP